MKTLIIETSGDQNALLLSDNGELVAYKPLPGGPELSKKLGLEVKSILQGFQPELIAIGKGPGSFTGIRVGAALAQGLAYGWGVPLLGFCSLKAWAPVGEEEFAVLVDARMGGIYTLMGKGTDFQKSCLLSLSEVERLDVSWLASPHPEIIQKRVAIKGKWAPSHFEPEQVVKLVYRQFLEEGAPPFELIYLSRP